uniref:Uncharacterized LOC103173745 n=1 Tax=Callorhinchus milii TaxID=7868 RepID=A0A4W3H293_CALMI
VTGKADEAVIITSHKASDFLGDDKRMKRNVKWYHKNPDFQAWYKYYQSIGHTEGLNEIDRIRFTYMQMRHLESVYGTNAPYYQYTLGVPPAPKKTLDPKKLLPTGAHCDPHTDPKCLPAKAPACDPTYNPNCAASSNPALSLQQQADPCDPLDPACQGQPGGQGHAFRGPILRSNHEEEEEEEEEEDEEEDPYDMARYYGNPERYGGDPGQQHDYYGQYGGRSPYNAYGPPSPGAERQPNSSPYDSPDGYPYGSPYDTPNRSPYGQPPNGYPYGSPNPYPYGAQTGYPYGAPNGNPYGSPYPGSYGSPYPGSYGAPYDPYAHEDEEGEEEEY